MLVRIGLDTPVRVARNVLMMQEISVDDIYINLKGVMWVSRTDDIRGFG